MTRPVPWEDVPMFDLDQPPTTPAQPNTAHRPGHTEPTSLAPATVVRTWTTMPGLIVEHLHREDLTTLLALPGAHLIHQAPPCRYAMDPTGTGEVLRIIGNIRTSPAGAIKANAATDLEPDQLPRLATAALHLHRTRPALTAPVIVYAPLHVPDSPADLEAQETQQ